MMAAADRTQGMSRWKGRVALVTGAAGGIGSAVVAKLLSHGIKVIGCDIQTEKIEKMKQQFSSDGSISGSFVPYQCNLSKEEEILKMFETIKTEQGGLDICINNAGHNINGPTLLGGSTEDWRSQIDINVLALCICTREAVKQMREKGVDDGQIVHIGSLAGHRHSLNPAYYFYSATKHMVTCLTEGLRRELAEMKSHIKISCISPPIVRSGFSYNTFSDPGIVDNMYDKDPTIEPNDVADAVIFALQAPPHVQVHDIIMQLVPK